MSVVASRRRCSRTVLPTAQARGSDGPAGSCSPYERCNATTSRWGSSLQCCHRRVGKVPAAPAGLTSLASVSAPCPLAGGDYPLCCHRRVRKGQRHKQALHLLRALQRHATVPEVVTSSAAIRVCEEGPAAPAGTPFLPCDAAPGRRAGCGYLPCCRQGVRRGGRRSQQARKSLTSEAASGLRTGCVHAQCGRQCVRNGGPAVPADLIPSLTCEAALCHCAGCGHLRRCHKRGQEGQQRQQDSHLVRALRRHSIVPEVFTYSAAISVCDERQQHQ